MTDVRKPPTGRQISDAKVAERLLYSQHEIGDPFAAAINGTRMAMIITGPSDQDNPIIFANKAFCRLTGYEHDEVIGQNCRFIQGPDTSRRAVERITHAIAREEDVHVELVNYRKDGTPFWNSLFLSPVRNSKGEVKFFFGSQLDVSDKKQTEFDLHSVNDELRETKTLLEQQIDDRTGELMRLLSQRSRLINELDHRVKNNLQLINSLLGFELRRDLGPEAREVVNRLHQRIDALGLAHKDQHNKEAIGYFRVDTFVRILVSKVLTNHPRWHSEPAYQMEEVLLPIGKAAPLALALNEFVRSLVSNTENIADGAKLEISAQTKNGKLVLDVSSADLTEVNCRRAFDGIEGWTMRLIERQLEARVEFTDMDGRCGVKLAMPLNGGSHGD